MTTERYLGQLRTIKRRIENKRREADMWRTIAESMGQATDGERVQSSGSGDKISDAVAKAVDFEREAEALTWRLINLQHTIILQIEQLPNDEYGLLLSEYYVHNMSVTEIAREWGQSYRHINRKKIEAIKDFARIYGRNY